MSSIPLKSAHSSPSPARSPNEAAVLPALDGITNRDLLRWMFRFLNPVKPLVIQACAWLVLWVGTEVLSTNQARNVVNEIQVLPSSGTVGHHTSFPAWLTSAATRPLLHQIEILAALILVMSVLRYVRETSNTRLSMTLVFYLREAIYDKLQRVGFAFHDVLSSGQLINRALSDLQNVRTFVQTAILTTLEIVLVVVGYMLLLAYMNKWIALLSLAPLPVWVWYITRFSRQVQPASKSVMEAGDKNVALLAENIAGVHVVKAFATEKYEVNKYNQNCDSFFEFTRKRIVMYANFTPAVRAIATASHLSLFLLGGILIIKGILHAGDFLILGIAMGAILTRLQMVGTISDQYQNAVVSARRLYEILMAPPTVQDRATAPLPPGPGNVHFQSVSFAYAPGKPVLHDVNLEIPGGSLVAIVGPTGAGKTTLVSLLARFYDPQSGRILIDGVDIRDVSLSSLRTETSMVFQETYLFSDTVTNNISYGRPDVADGNVEAAARLAQAHEFIETLPKGYSTMLGERGASLSGGQKQRLAIARAICVNPRILILDDATAAVDPETEDLIRKAMRFVMQGRTTFVIAHRISTVKRADVVVVLENGRVTGIGTHDHLMSTNKHYREIARVQLYGDEDAIPHSPPSHMDRMLDEKTVQQKTAEAKDIAEQQHPAPEL